ncbi:hypothetical protein Psal159_02595 [Piscirickettsia salmonis]|nr:hypothetical protein KW89_525 [Piscirickettsia salmonis]QGO81568.1 hypothetical protein Psal107_02597 [Piscirickettsia salmonis]QGP23444.1 hypothetical protein Psal158_02596 [Piscirickettsia salmonis]QGP26824.1 hypothetical protein Psal159_02595 [Piscirickettsia salmonis]QGP30204.1 hypothetical protein Psal160_02592 [Piscirickettsia salmonis]
MDDKTQSVYYINISTYYTDMDTKKWDSISKRKF